MPARSSIVTAAPAPAKISRSTARSNSCARAWVAELAAALATLLLTLPARGLASPRLSAQQDPGLRPVVEHAIQQTQCFIDRYDSAVWYTLMEPKLRRYVGDPAERLEILRAVYCESHHRDGTALPPGLVLAVLDVESRFDPWAVSNAGAVGLMQVMPFWPEQLGMRRYQLTRVTENIHMGCAILRYYLASERRDIRRALERYNGSLGHRDYPDRVIVRWTTYWNGADDLGRPHAG